MTQLTDEDRALIFDAIKTVLSEFRLDNMADENGLPYPLLDLMSNPAPDDIGAGLAQIDSLAWEIGDAVLALLSAARTQSQGEGWDEPTRWLLRYVDASGGKVSASEYRGNPIDLWCDDRGQETDTLNVAIEDGLLSCSHNSDTDESWVWITDAGRRALPAPPASQTKEG